MGVTSGDFTCGIGKWKAGLLSFYLSLLFGLENKFKSYTGITLRMKHTRPSRAPCRGHRGSALEASRTHAPRPRAPFPTPITRGQGGRSAALQARLLSCSSAHLLLRAMGPRGCGRGGAPSPGVDTNSLHPNPGPPCSRWPWALGPCGRLRGLPGQPVVSAGGRTESAEHEGAGAGAWGTAPRLVLPSVFSGVCEPCSGPMPLTAQILTTVPFLSAVASK